MAEITQGIITPPRLDTKSNFAIAEAPTLVQTKENAPKITTKYVPPNIIRNPDDPYNPYKISGIVFQREFTKTDGAYPVHTIHVQPCKAIVATDGVQLPNGNVNSILVHEETEMDRLEAGLRAVVDTFQTTKPEKYLVFSATDTVSDRGSSDMAKWRNLPLSEWLETHGIVNGGNAVVIVDDFWVERLQWTVKPNGEVIVKLNKQYIDIPESKLPESLKKELQQIRRKIQEYNRMQRDKEAISSSETKPVESMQNSKL